MPVSELGAADLPGRGRRAGRPGRVGAGRARQRRAPFLRGGRAAALPRARLLPGPSRAVGVPRPGLPGGRRAVARAAGSRRHGCTRSRRRPAPAARGSSSCYTCRHCGSAYARAYTNDLASPAFLWHEPGVPFQSAAGSIDRAFRARPAPGGPPSAGGAEVGRSRPGHRAAQPRRTRASGAAASTSTGTDPGRPSRGNDDDDEDEGAGQRRVQALRRVRRRSAGFGRSSVQDHQTKGDQPFQALITRQLEVQPPGPQPDTDFAPLRGRKVLAFSDSRQVAARLAPNLQTYAMRDVIRPLILRGWSELAAQPRSGEQPQPGAAVPRRHGRREAPVRPAPPGTPPDRVAAGPRTTSAAPSTTGALDGNLARPDRAAHADAAAAAVAAAGDLRDAHRQVLRPGLARPGLAPRTGTLTQPSCSPPSRRSMAWPRRTRRSSPWSGCGSRSGRAEPAASGSRR